MLSLSIMLYWSCSELRVEQKEHQACICCSVCSSGTALCVPRKQLLHIHISTPSVFTILLYREPFCHPQYGRPIYVYAAMTTNRPWAHGLSRCIMGCLWLLLIKLLIITRLTKTRVITTSIKAALSNWLPAPGVSNLSGPRSLPNFVMHLPFLPRDAL